MPESRTMKATVVLEFTYPHTSETFAQITERTLAQITPGLDNRHTVIKSVHVEKA